jgi:hypothetical protein
MHPATGATKARTESKKAWVAPKAVVEKVRDITEGNAAHRSTPDGICSS